MYDELVKRLRAAAIMSEALSIFLPHSEGSAVAKLYNEAAEAIEELCKREADMTHNMAALSLKVLRAEEKRPLDCPLVSVPPHGDLIDRDALIKELEITEEDDHNGATLLMAVFLEVLKSAPTIIPASEEGE